MVKLGEDYKEDKKEVIVKPRNKWKDFGEFLEDHWWGLLIAGLILSWVIGDIGDAVKPYTPIVKEKAVIVEVLDSYEDYKVKYLSDGVLQVVDLGNDAYIVGDTVLAER